MKGQSRHLQGLPQVCNPVGEHPIDANISAMLQNILQDLAKDTEPYCVQPIFQFIIKHWPSQVTLNVNLYAILLSLFSHSSRALFLAPKRWSHLIQKGYTSDTRLSIVCQHHILVVQTLLARSRYSHLPWEKSTATSLNLINPGSIFLGILLQKKQSPEKTLLYFDGEVCNNCYFFHKTLLVRGRMHGVQQLNKHIIRPQSHLL